MQMLTSLRWADNKAMSDSEGEWFPKPVLTADLENLVACQLAFCFITCRLSEEGNVFAGLSQKCDHMRVS